MVAISYDEPETLRAFARQRGIGYPLLSDAGSRTIDAYALRNEKARGRTAGIPHPGTILVDRAGVVRARLFHEGYQRRHGPDDILAAAARLD